ncbi:MAG: hypothetical protein NTX61_08235 [Bacteroidetes bacterium]|nr:hypothetical protein [Bacteroidota bacterium]
MNNDKRAVHALETIVKQYPAGTASLFSGHLSNVPPTGKNLTAAIRRGDISSYDLYDATFGAYSDLSGNDPIFQAIATNAGISTSAKPEEKSKFVSALDTILGTASKAADIYAKINPKAKPRQEHEQDNSVVTKAAKSPWLLIAAVAIVVVIVVVLVITKKK